MNILNLKQSFRNLQRNKIYSFTNLASLGVASGFILLIAAYTRHALVMDKFSDKVQTIYRIEAAKSWNKPDTSKKKGFFDWLANTSNQQYQLVTPLILAEDLKQNFSEIKEVCRIQTTYEPVIKINNQRFKEDGKHVAFVDKNFFSFFDLRLINANQASAFSGNSSVVISERSAKKYFGSENPVGKVLSLGGEDNQLFTVSAIAKNFPLNSSMQFDILLPVEGRSGYEEKRAQGINTSSFLTLIQLQKGTNFAAFTKKLTVFGEQYFKPWLDLSKKYNPDVKDAKINLSVRSFSKAHFNASSPWFYFTDVKSLYQLIFLALIALGIACLNYVLLSLSRVAARSHEAGVRKAVGAGWKHIINMFLTETWVLVMLSMATGFVLAIIALPYFNELTGVSIAIIEILNWKFFSIAFGLTLVLTLVAGIYPSIKMAGISPLTVLSKFGTYKLNPALSKIFIALQYTACTVLIVLSIVIARQIDFVNNKDLGFDKDQTLIVRNPFWGNNEKTVSLGEQLHQYVALQPAIAGITGSTFRYGNGLNMNGHNINGQKEMIAEITVDYDYFELNKIPFVEGRAFSRQYSSDTTRLTIPKEQLDTLGSQKKTNLVVNETLYNMLGRPPLNELNKPLGGIIVGVCRDYFFEGLQQKIGPLYHICRPGHIGYFWFKIGSHQRIASVVGMVKSKFNSLTNGEDFTYSFMDDDVKVLYESHERWLKVISAASWMAIFIACLGLFGLSALVVVNRTKEIGIRKVLGASVLQLFYTLNKQSLVMVLLSIIIAVPIAIYISDSWLQNFAYRISLNWVFFAIAAMIGFVCALTAVSYHTLKMANTNPVKSLRTE
jgi:putative ABC transport system permease protein